MALSTYCYKYQRSIYVPQAIDTTAIYKKKKKGMITIGQRDQRRLPGVGEQ